MRRFILFMLCLCVHWIARGQTSYDYRYWFDNDINSASSGTSAGSTWHISVPLDGLEESLHVFHFQVCDTAGVWSAPVSRYFVKLTQPIEEQGTYWFDDDYSTHIISPVTNGIMEVDVSALADGFHAFHYMAGAHTLSAVRTSFFIKQTDPSQFHYLIWAADDPENILKGKYTGEPVNVDVSSLTDGFHTLYVQVVGGASATHPSSAMFIKIPQTVGVDYMNCLFMVDDKFYRSEQVPASGGIIKWTLDVDHLDQGLHRYLVQVVTPSGAGSTIKEGFFLRETMKSELQSLQCCFMVDGDSATVQAGTISNGVYHFDLDVSKLTDGLHRIAYWLVGDNAVSTTVNSSFFVKTPVGGNGITQYHYWLNDLEAEKHVIQLAQRVNPLSIITLLPVETQPLRSANFQFAFKNGQPLVYAKNELHLRFFDAANRFTQITKEYVDEQVTRSVEPVGELQATQTFPRVAENNIRWYTVQAEQGDSLSFKLDRAATIQLFSPNGQEVFNSSGSASVTWDGCQTMEDGIFYLAVHDVTATQGSTMTLEYNRIGKYAVLAYTPDCFSSDGTTFMHIEGNGLEYVTSLELIQGESTLCPDTMVSNRTDLLARFKLNEGLISAKKYDLKLSFHNEQENDSHVIRLENAVTLEPMHKDDISVDIATEHRVGDPYPIRVTLKNTGNVGYYGIPVNVAFDNPDRIDEFLFVNFDMLLSEELYESRQFFAYTDNLVGTGKKGFFLPMFVPYLGPKEEKTFIFGVRTKIAHAKFNFYAWAGEPIYDGLDEVMPSGVKSNVRRKAPPCATPSNIPDVYEALGNVDNLTDMPISPSRVLRPFIGAAEAIAGIIQGSTRAREKAIFDVCGIPQSERDNYRFQYRHNVRSPYDIARDSHPFQIRRKAAASGAGSAVDSHASGDCPRPDSHGVDVYIPGDPNEITGYLAESGSHYISDSIGTVSYDIEFENAPELANSSAHMIVIDNQLDPTLFDLSSFIPNEITISDKKLELTGEQNFVKTIDMRPNINAIAEIKCEYDQSTGHITWILSSLDPMTMETTDDIMQGILPINSNANNGIGHVTYTVNLRQTLDDGVEIHNQASIIFDNNDPVLTPAWVNTVDAIAPTSTILGAIQAKTDTLTLRIAGEDNRSGVWRYDVYAQIGQGSSWEKVAENVPAILAEGETETLVDVRIFEGIEYGFMVLATDSAGNMERKAFEAEFELSTVKTGDANGDGVVDALDVILATSYYLSKDVHLNFAAADVVADGEINSLDVIAIQNIYLNSSQQALSPRKRKVKSDRTNNI